MSDQPYEKGTVLVPQGRRAVVVDGYDANGNLLAHPVGGGLPRVINPNQDGALHGFTDLEPRARSARHPKFSLNETEDDFIE